MILIICAPLSDFRHSPVPRQWFPEMRTASPDLASLCCCVWNEKCTSDCKYSPLGDKELIQARLSLE